MTEEISNGNGVDAKAAVAKKRKKKGTEKKIPSKRKSVSARKPKQVDEKYDIEVHPETGAMLLPEIHYYRLVVAEQQIKIRDRDLEIAKARLRDFQAQANIQLQSLQAKVKEASNLLNESKASYFMEVQVVEDATKLDLKDWMIDDDRILRPVEKKPPAEELEAQ